MAGKRGRPRKEVLVVELPNSQKPIDGISKEEWQHWISLPCTQTYLTDLFNVRDFLKEGIVMGEHSNETARLIDIGKCQGFRYALAYATTEFEYAGKNDQPDKEDENNEV